MTDAGLPRWRGQPGRLEVWYATATDAATGAGLWLHHELVAPVAGEPYVHGWVAVFPVETSPTVVRFGPEPVAGVHSQWIRGSGYEVGPQRLAGDVDGASWDLAWQSDQPPMWTMGAAAWRREVLPSSQVVLAPKARFRGRLRVRDSEHPIDAIGNLAHIYGHGNAQRWAWLHADLDERSSLEIVAAVGRRPGLRRLPPLSFVQLRREGHDWPRRPLVAAPLFRARLGSTEWSVRGVVGTHRLTVTVAQPEARSVHLDYTDPDGAGATCSNTELADAEIRLEKWSGRWSTEAEWSLTGRAHAERGDRP